ncbi:MAG: MFS transporter [Clostridia bacterium]
MKLSYRHTIYACYLGEITAAIINNFTPLLLLTFQSSFQIPLSQVTLLVTFNFAVQFLVDFLGSKYADRIGHRRCMVAGHFACAAGLIGMAVLPVVLPSPFAGLLISVMLYAIGGGINEVLASPIVESCPTKEKAFAMSLLHSFYCWGHVLVVLVSTAFFAIFGLHNWPVLACLWASVPLVNAFFFTKVPLVKPDEENRSMNLRELGKNKLFWMLMMVMVCAGASEQGMSQWSSAFAESALGVSKTLGDLAGPCSFALFMGLSRLVFARATKRYPLMPLLMLSTGLCAAAYLLAALTRSPVLGLVGCGLCGFSVGAMWPGTFSLGAEKCPRGGTAMFALFALAGDLGCSGGPTVVGMVAKGAGDHLQTGLLVAVVFPLLLLLVLWRLSRMKLTNAAQVKSMR